MRSIFASGLLCFALIVPVRAQQPHSEAANDIDRGKPQQRGTEASPIVVRIEGAQTEEYKAVEDRRRDDADAAVKRREFRLTLAIAIAAGIQALAALIQIFIYLRQSKLMADSLKATQENAKAALISAETLVNAERPFVMVELDGNEFWAVNYGKSPAQIIFSNPSPLVSWPKMDNLPEHLHYGVGYENSMQFNVPWIPPKGRYSLGYFDATIVEELGEPLLTELKNCTKVFLVYSSLKYRGIDQKTIYESTYCYRRFGGKLLMWGGYPWWNECT